MSTITQNRARSLPFAITIQNGFFGLIFRCIILLLLLSIGIPALTQPNLKFQHPLKNYTILIKIGVIKQPDRPPLTQTLTGNIC